MKLLPKRANRQSVEVRWLLLRRLATLAEFWMNQNRVQLSPRAHRAYGTLMTELAKMQPPGADPITDDIGTIDDIVESMFRSENSVFTIKSPSSRVH